MGRVTRRSGVLAAVAAIVLAACSSGSPRSELLEAVDRSFSGSFAYTLRFESEPGSDDDTGDDTGLGSLVGGLEVSGQRVDGRDALVVRVLGVDVFELRAESPDRLHARLGLGRLFRFAAGGDVDPSAAIVEVLQSQGAEPDVLDTVQAGLRGDWLTVEGHLDTVELERILAGEGDPAEADAPALRGALCEDLRGFVGCFVDVQGVTEAGSERTYHVELDVAELVRRLGSLDPTNAVVGPVDLPRRVPGRVTTRGGLVRSVEADLARPDASGGGTTVRVRLEVREHGSVQPTPAPRATTVVSAERFLTALEALMTLTADLDARP
ncbi:MAG: hypothetical protein ACRDUY_14660 [Nitriliruptorales bacterium]